MTKPTLTTEERNARRMESVERYTAEALDLFNAGFASKAAQKRATDALNRAYEALRDVWHSAQIARAPHNDLDRLMTEAEAQERHAFFYGEGSVDTPFGLHEVRAKHEAAFEQFLPGSWATVARLIELRAEIKAAPVVPPAKDQTKVRTAKVVKHLKELMELRKAQFLEAVDLTEVLGDEGVIIKGLTANTHYVRGHKGTDFLRTFFYLRGKLTPLNVILAGAEEKARQERA